MSRWFGPDDQAPPAVADAVLEAADDAAMGELADAFGMVLGALCEAGVPFDDALKVAGARARQLPCLDAAQRGAARNRARQLGEHA